MTATKEFEEWFFIASDDLDVANGCLEKFYPKKLAIACYHSQQAAEKSLKGYLVSQGEKIEKTHDLQLLCEKCIQKDVTFNEIYEASSKLSLYASAPRYPKEIVVDETIAKISIERAQKVYDFCMMKIPKTEV
jgi:HEPN domain-containing protein